MQRGEEIIGRETGEQKAIGKTKEKERDLRYG